MSVAPRRAAMLGAVVGLVLLAIGAWAGMPAADHDASYFAGSALAAAHGDGLVNRADPLLADQDPLGLSRFIAYPIGFPAILGAFRAPTISGLYLVMWGLAALVLLTHGARLARLAKGGGPLAALLAFAAGPALASMSANGAFRPEVVNVLLVLCWAALVEQSDDGPRRDLLLGALAGAAGLVQVPMLIYGALAWPILASLRHEWRVFVLRGCYAAVGAIAVFALGTWLHPFGGREYYEAFVGFSRRVLSQPSLESWRSYWVTGTRYPLLILPFALAGIAGWPAARARLQTAKLPVIGVLGVMGIAAFAWANTWRTPTRWYEASVFLVIAQGAIVRAVAQRTGEARWRRVGVVALLAFAANALAADWRAVQGVRALLAGTDVRSAQRALAAELSREHGRVAAAPPAGLLLREPTQGCAVYDDRDGLRIGCGTPVALLVRFDGRAGRDAPSVADSAGTRWMVRCRFWPLAGRERGWSFSVWERAVARGEKSPSGTDGSARVCGAT